MSVFVDTGVFYAHQHERASRHDVATDALRATLSGEYGRLYTSDYVHDEAVTLVRKRTGSFEGTKAVSDRILDSGSPISILQVDRPRVRESVETFERYRDHDLSFTDATIISQVEANDIDTVLSFDDDFDGIVDRTDPSEVV
ncbi:type II toxin-antitoxin system VapC family toxin [Natronomonas amylolytica]|uniref:type II toxin-antitoxin system VapC family toxin n=1 Tax=Natronomonas amylolytica TaxID=3108498 RepID=UPI003007F312